MCDLLTWQSASLVSLLTQLTSPQHTKGSRKFSKYDYKHVFFIYNISRIKYSYLSCLINDFTFSLVQKGKIKYMIAWVPFVLVTNKAMTHSDWLMGICSGLSLVEAWAGMQPKACIPPSNIPLCTTHTHSSQVHSRYTRNDSD